MPRTTEREGLCIFFVWAIRALWMCQNLIDFLENTFILNHHSPDDRDSFLKEEMIFIMMMVACCLDRIASERLSQSRHSMMLERFSICMMSVECGMQEVRLAQSRAERDVWQQQQQQISQERRQLDTQRDALKKYLSSRIHLCASYLFIP